MGKEREASEGGAGALLQHGKVCAPAACNNPLQWCAVPLLWQRIFSTIFAKVSKMRALGTVLPPPPHSSEIISASAVKTGKSRNQKTRSAGRLAKSGAYILGAMLAASFVISSAGCVTVRVRHSDGKVSVYRPFSGSSSQGGGGDTFAAAKKSRSCTPTITPKSRPRARVSEEEREKLNERLADAIAAGSPIEVQRLLDSGADINAVSYHDNKYRYRYSKSTPLVRAARSGNLNLVRLLLENGADVNLEDRDRRKYATNDTYTYTPLGAARNVDVARLLIENCADVNAKMSGSRNSSSTPDLTPLSIAATRSDGEDMVALLLENGADVNPRLLSHGEEYTLLGKAAYELSPYTECRGCTNIGWRGVHNAKSIALLIEHGADVRNLKDTFNNSVNSWKLFYGAAIAGSASAVQRLLDEGLDINGQGEYEGFALRKLLDNGYWDGAGLLIEKGARYDEAAMLRQYGRNEHAARVLVKKAADVNAKDKNGMTALMRAVEFNEDKKQYNPQTQVVKSLLEKGADVNARDARGWTALDYVEHGEKHAIASDETQTAATEELASNYGPIMGALVRSAASLGADMHGMKVKKEEWAEAKRLLVAAGAKKSGAGLQAGEKAVVAESQVREDLLGAMREAKKNVAPILAPIKSVDEAVTECITGGEGCKVEGVSIQANCTDVIWSGCNIKMKVSPPGGRDYSGESWTGQGAGLIIPKEELKPGHHAYTMTFLDVGDRVFGVCSGTFHLDGNETRVFIGFDKDDVKRGKCDAYISKQ